MDVYILDTREPFKYQIVAEKVEHLPKFGMNIQTIAKHLGVNWDTVLRALEWNK